MTSIGHTLSQTSTRELQRLGLVASLTMATGLAFVLLACFEPSVLLLLYERIASTASVADMLPASRFGAALFGALTVGWGFTLHRLSAGVHLSRAAVTGALVWFVIDSSASLWLGFGWNVVLNVGFLALFVLLLPWRATR